MDSIPVRELISFPVRELNPFPVREMTQNLHKFTPSSPILKIFAFLEMASKFISTLLCSLENGLGMHFWLIP